MDILEKINEYLLENEQLADEFLPLKATLDPIKGDINNALTTLREKASSSTDLSDRIFYVNRYTDLIKKVESIFDTRSKRLQQTISMLAKLDLRDSSGQTDQGDNESVNEDVTLTPEQANAILKIIHQGKIN